MILFLADDDVLHSSGGNSAVAQRERDTNGEKYCSLWAILVSGQWMSQARDVNSPTQTLHTSDYVWRCQLAPIHVTANVFTRSSTSLWTSSSTCLILLPSHRYRWRWRKHPCCYVITVHREGTYSWQQQAMHTCSFSCSTATDWHHLHVTEHWQSQRRRLTWKQKKPYDVCKILLHWMTKEAVKSVDGVVISGSLQSLHI